MTAALVLPCLRCGEQVTVPGDHTLIPELPPPGHECTPSPADTIRRAAAELRTRIVMHRRYADPLADWLEAEASRLDATALSEWQETVGPHALAVARAVLGEEAQR